MDQWLAEVYGTGGAGAMDLEKTAQAMMLNNLAEAEGVDLSSLSDEELEALAAEVLQAQGEQQGQDVGGQQVPTNQQHFQGQQAPLAQQTLAQQAAQHAQYGQQGQQAPMAAPGMDQEMAVKEAQAKFQEADFLGRVMAHAYNQESEKIASNRAEQHAESVRGPIGAAEKQKMRGLSQSGGSSDPSHAMINARAASGGGAAGGGGVPQSTPFQRHGMGSLKGALSRLKGHASEAVNAVGGAIKAHPGKAGLAAGAALAGGGALAAHHMGHEKSAFDTMARDRALQILAENGIDPNAQQQGPEQQAPQVQEQQFAEALEKRAYEILAANGYVQE